MRKDASPRLPGRTAGTKNDRPVAPASSESSVSRPSTAARCNGRSTAWRAARRAESAVMKAHDGEEEGLGDDRTLQYKPLPSESLDNRWRPASRASAGGCS